MCSFVNARFRRLAMRKHSKMVEMFLSRRPRLTNHIRGAVLPKIRFAGFSHRCHKLEVVFRGGNLRFIPLILRRAYCYGFAHGIQNPGLRISGLTCTLLSVLCRTLSLHLNFASTSALEVVPLAVGRSTLNANLSLNARHSGLIEVALLAP